MTSAISLFKCSVRIIQDVPPLHFKQEEAWRVILDFFRRDVRTEAEQGCETTEDSRHGWRGLRAGRTAHPEENYCKTLRQDSYYVEIDSIAVNASTENLTFRYHVVDLSGSQENRYTILTKFLRTTNVNGVLIRASGTHSIALIRASGQNIWRVFDTSGHHPPDSSTPAHGSIFDPNDYGNSIFYKTYTEPVKFEYF